VYVDRTLLAPDPLPELILAGAGASPLVQDLGVCLLAAGFLSALFERLRIPTIAALLGAGVLVGPLGLGLVHGAADIETIANLGLTLLLFVIGLEINPRSLVASGRTLLLTGALQVPLTVLAAMGAFHLLRPWLPVELRGEYMVLYLGLACGFSSTLLVVRYLQERRWLDTLAGRLAVGLLIFQDIWAIVVLALQPSFESPRLSPIALTFAGIAALVVMATLGARFVLPHAFRFVAKIPDLVVSLAIAWCFAVGLFGAHLGTFVSWLGVQTEVSVSMEMGALIAGMTIASFPYHHDVAARVANVRDFFVTLFFVALGLSLPVPSSAAIVVLAVGLSLVALLLRLLVFFPVLYLTGLDRNNALDAAIKLGQVSEFCLVITYLGVKAGHVTPSEASVVALAFVMTAVFTPTLFDWSRRLPIALGPVLDRLGFRVPPQHDAHTADAQQSRIVMLGFHRVAAALLQDIGRRHPEWLPQIVVLDLNVGTHAAIRELGARVVYGNVGSAEALRHAHVERAELVISSVPDELLRGTSNEAIVRAVRSVAPNATVFACASSAQAVTKIYQAGASYVYMPSVETANGLCDAAEAALGALLADYRARRDASCGALEERADLRGMTS
jgi:Kef-type K+ transport system membrane component KefB